MAKRSYRPGEGSGLIERGYRGGTPSGPSVAPPSPGEFRERTGRVDIEGRPITPEVQPEKKYVLAGKDVSREEYERVTKPPVVLGGRVTEEFLRKATSQERAELLAATRQSRLLVGSRGSFAWQKRTSEGTSTQIESSVRLQREAAAREQQREAQRREEVKQEIIDPLSLRGQIEVGKRFMAPGLLSDVRGGVEDIGVGYYQTIRHPIKTIMETPESLKEIYRKISTGTLTRREQIGLAGTILFPGVISKG